MSSKGFYIVPLTNPISFYKFENGTVNNFISTVINCKNDHETAIKLHCLFGYASKTKLLQLINSAGDKWLHNKNVKKEREKVTAECEICMMFHRPGLRPVVGLPMATFFNECVAMDLKFYKGKLILHMIDHVSRWWW